MSDKIITFAKTLTVGIKGYQDLNIETPSLGFMTPNTADSAYKKRLDTLKSWTQVGRYYDHATKQYVENTEDPNNLHEIDNSPTTGFQILNVESRYSNDNKVFRLKDPRGFLLEIYTGNLEVILQTSDILKGGYIAEPCVWGRQGSNNILVAVSSEAYKTSAKFAESKTTDMKTVVPGDILKFKTGPEEIYLGEFTVISLNKEDRVHRLQKNEKIHAFIYGDNRIRVVKKPGVFAVIGKSDVKIEEIYIKKESCNIDRLGDNWRTESLALFNKDINVDSFKFTLSKEKILYDLDKDGYYLDVESGIISVFGISYFTRTDVWYNSIYDFSENSYKVEPHRHRATSGSNMNALKRNEIVAITGIKAVISTIKGEIVFSV